MNKSLVALALVAGCGASGDQNAAAPAPAQTAQTKSAPAASSPVRASAGESFGGLWQGGDTRRPNQLCVVKRGDTPQFGLVVWGANMRSCSGAGTLRREGDRVTLTMTGDSACSVPGRVEGRRLVLGGGLPAGCSYYCGAGAKLEGAAFTQVGTTAADAAKAKDLAGDPLCG